MPRRLPRWRPSAEPPLDGVPAPGGPHYRARRKTAPPCRQFESDSSCGPYRAHHRGRGSPVVWWRVMYLVTKRIEFCYGHRLLDYDGVCKHPHGHNALAEVEVRTDRLDSRNMVADFSDIKRVVKGWIDRELDHKMILRHDDPLVAPLRELGEPMYLLESNPTVERIARLIFDKGREQGVDIVSVRVGETPSSFATYTGEP